MSNDPQPDNTLPGDLDDDDLDEVDEDVEINNDLPDGKQPPRGRGNSRGKSDQAPGQTKKP
jgi:hypothetical protein